MSNEALYGVKGVLPLFPETERKENVCISCFEFDSHKDPLFNLRAVRDGGRMFYVHDGKYVRLHVNGELVMSDTGMERYSNLEIIQRAHGRVLIAGLGIGLVLHNILDKPEVTEVIVIEKEQAVIDLVAPKFSHPKLLVICADIYTWRPVKGDRFNTIYFDIWSTIEEDNLIDIRRLHNAFKGYLNREDPYCYMNSWLKSFLQYRRKQSLQSAYRW